MSKERGMTKAWAEDNAVKAWEKQLRSRSIQDASAHFRLLLSVCSRIFSPIMDIDRLFESDRAQKATCWKKLLLAVTVQPAKSVPRDLITEYKRQNQPCR